MNQPLAFKLRPTNIDGIIGQEHLTGQNSVIRKMINENKLFSMILFGPPGTGKTTLATVLANSLNLHYIVLNATINNKKDLENAIEEGKLFGHIVIIMDEVHRMNKDKQDILLPYIESGLVTLIGATTANPYHSINPAIRSRCHLFEFKALSNEDIILALKNALTSKEGLDNKFIADAEALLAIAKLSSGDIRYALNQLELVSLCCKDNHITVQDISNNIKTPQYMFDKDEDNHYDAVSALQKSIRGSDVDAALYYLARLIAADDFESIERRLTVTAYEDIGLANPNAVSRCIQAIETVKTLGFPEGAIPLGVAVVDLCLSPKSKSGCLGIEKALEVVSSSSLPIPKYLRYTPVGLREEEKYPYDRPDLWEKIQYLPDQIKNIRFYEGIDSSSYEHALLENNKRLKSIQKVNDLSKLK